MLDYTGTFEKIAFSLSGAPADAVKILGTTHISVPKLKNRWNPAFYNEVGRKTNATATMALDAGYTKNLFKERLKKGFN